MACFETLTQSKSLNNLQDALYISREKEGTVINVCMASRQIRLNVGQLTGLHSNRVVISFLILVRRQQLEICRINAFAMLPKCALRPLFRFLLPSRFRLLAVLSFFCGTSSIGGAGLFLLCLPFRQILFFLL
jgi:hypothetical protein